MSSTKTNVAQLPGHEQAGDPDAEAATAAHAVRILYAINPDLATAIAVGSADPGMNRQLLDDVRSITELIMLASHETQERSAELEGMSVGSLSNAAYLASRLLTAALDDGGTPHWWRSAEDEGQDAV